MLFLNGKKIQENAFNVLKKKLSNVSLLVLPNFDKTFEIECDGVIYA